MGYTRSQAIQILFKKKIADYEFFKQRLTGFEDTKTIKFEHLAKMSGEGGRGKRIYHSQHFNLLYNVVIISAFFGKPAIVHEIVTNTKHRERHIDEIKHLLGNRLIIGTCVLNKDLLSEFFTFMSSSKSLIEEKVPNPFVELPQFLVNKKERYISVYEAYKASSTEKTAAEIMLLAYFDKNIEHAFYLAKKLSGLQGYELQVQSWILKKHEDALRLDNLLDDFIN